ncbi:hypothetical protein RIF29_34397 [Crotalaria pallida]|uniref:D-isomer specific 2-hydroxyacid dehydrogenase NAD-binding domain-containing protein n=1 Tax=Crotalaria pallida TaxID=3830 RepID=A0AAN9HUN4_CROPI
MAAMEGEHNHNDNKELKPLLVYGPPLVFQLFESNNSHKYHFLKAFSSDLPLLQFLTTQNVEPSSIRAILCNPYQQVTADVIRLLPFLAIIVTTSIGTNHIDLPECHSRAVKVVSIGALFADDVADMAMGLLIDVLCNISAADRYVRNLVPSKLWNLPLGSKLGGKTVGIVGLGRIGGEVAKRLEAFDCRIMYHSRSKKPLVSYPFYSNIVELASNSDVLIRGEIKGAGLDVFENEPNVSRELITMDNVVLSPHAAALTSEFRLFL